MEPAPVLVAAFEVEVCRELEVLAFLNDGGKAHARVEPDIEDVLFLLELGALALLARGTWGRKFRGAFFEPDVCAVLLDFPGEIFDEARVKERKSRQGSREERRRHLV